MDKETDMEYHTNMHICKHINKNEQIQAQIGLPLIYIEKKSLTFPKLLPSDKMFFPGSI